MQPLRDEYHALFNPHTSKMVLFMWQKDSAAVATLVICCLRCILSLEAEIFYLSCMKQSWGLLNLPLALYVPLLSFLCISHLVSQRWLGDVILLLERFLQLKRTYENIKRHSGLRAQTATKIHHLSKANQQTLIVHPKAAALPS